MSNHYLPTEAAQLPEMIDDDNEPTVSIVHVTITASGTVIYTHTATSYSYIPTYSAVHPTNTMTSNSNNSNGNNNISTPGSGDSSGSKSALIGGIVGGVGGFVALVLIAFLLVRRSHLKKKKRNQNTIGNRDHLYPTSPMRMHHVEEVGPHYYDPNETVQGYYEDRLSSHHHGGYSKYASNPPPPKNNRRSAMTDSAHSGTSSPPVMCQVPNEIERNVPHLKENEPPHTK